MTGSLAGSLAGPLAGPLAGFLAAYLVEPLPEPLGFLGGADVDGLSSCPVPGFAIGSLRALPARVLLAALGIFLVELL